MNVPPIDGQIRRNAGSRAEARDFGSVEWVSLEGDPPGAEMTLGVAVFEVCGNPRAELKPRAPGSRLERFAEGIGRLAGFAGFEQPESVSLEQRGDRIDLRRGRDGCPCAHGCEREDEEPHNQIIRRRVYC